QRWNSPPPPPNVTPVPRPTPPLPPKIPIDGQIAVRGATVSDTHVCASRPSASFVLRAGAPQLRTTSSYAAPCHEERAAPTSPTPEGLEAQPARRSSTPRVMRRIGSLRVRHSRAR